MTKSASLLILGCGEIARCLARLATVIGYPVAVSDRNVSSYEWPEKTELYEKYYVDDPWVLSPGTHAIIARGHEGDTESVACMLNRGVERLYLVASARRAQDVIEAARTKLSDPALLDKLSAPAGLELGGNDSMEIAISILAEVQMRQYQASGAPLANLRLQRILRKDTGKHNVECPGKRS